MKVLLVAVVISIIALITVPGSYASPVARPLQTKEQDDTAKEQIFRGIIGNAIRRSFPTFPLNIEIQQDDSDDDENMEIKDAQKLLQFLEKNLQTDSVEAKEQRNSASDWVNAITKGYDLFQRIRNDFGDSETGERFANMELDDNQQLLQAKEQRNSVSDWVNALTKGYDLFQQIRNDFGETGQRFANMELDDNQQLLDKLLLNEQEDEEAARAQFLNTLRTSFVPFGYVPQQQRLNSEMQQTDNDAQDESETDVVDMLTAVLQDNSKQSEEAKEQIFGVIGGLSKALGAFNALRGAYNTITGRGK